MAFPTDWGRKCAVTIDADFVSGTTHADFPVLLTEDVLPSEMFDADGSYPALNGGGDIRFSSDSAGSTQLACEIVSFVTDNNPASGSAEIWVLVPTLSGSVDTTIYVWYNKTGESQPAVTDTYGRNVVWADYIVAAHLKETSGSTAVDSSGNRDGTYGSSLPAQSGVGQLFDDSVNGHVDFGGGLLGISADWTMSAAIKPSTLSGTHQVISSDNSAGGNDRNFHFRQDGDEITLIRFSSTNTVRNSTTSASSPLSTSVPTRIAATFSTTSGSAGYADGVSVLTDSNTGTTGDQNNLARLVVGGRWRSDIGFNTEPFGGEIGEFRLTNIARSVDWIATEYANQNDPATFASAGTPESVGGATITLSNLTFASRTATSITPRIDVTVS